ncbi:MAG: hypothetical protein HN403_17500 [Rhodospirillales bacterium]|jgi:hypothetical protein|nr:hypothetical protein [Rhodospirillales bacterium]
MRKSGYEQPVKDENLRLILARDEKKYIRKRMVNSRKSAFSSAKVLAVAVLIGLALWPVLLVVSAAFATSTASSMVVTAVSIGFIVVVPILAIHTLMSVSQYRRCQGYERDLRNFLKKYNRTWDTV